MTNYFHDNVNLAPPTGYQISDVQLMKLIRRKVKLAMPYAGAFLKKDDRFAPFSPESCDFVFLSCVAIVMRLK